MRSGTGRRAARGARPGRCLGRNGCACGAGVRGGGPFYGLKNKLFEVRCGLENSSISSCRNDTLSSTASGTGTVVKLPHQAILDPHPCLPDASCRSLHVIICAHVACVWGVCDTGEFLSTHRMLH